MIDWHSFPAPAARAEDVQTPQTEDINRQLERICESVAFRGSLRLTRFLRFVVATALAGKSDTIKAYTIAVEALDRGAEFDPQSDPIVRVEAGRLRLALTRYYAGPGCNDPVVIELPRGAYVPTFNRRAVDAAPPTNENGWPHGPRSPLPTNFSGYAGGRHRFGHDALRFPGRTGQFRRNMSSQLDLANLHHQRITSFREMLHATRRMLVESRDLLQASADWDLACIQSLPEPPVPRGSGGAPPAARLNSEKGSDGGICERAGQSESRQKSRAAPIWSEVSLAISAIFARAGTKKQILRITFCVFVVLAILEVVFDINQPFIGGGAVGSPLKLGPTRDAVAKQSAAVGGEPLIYVEPIEAVGEPTPDVPSPSMIRERMFDALARFDGAIFVSDLPRDGTAAFGGKSAPNYRLSTAVNYFPDGAVMEAVRLIDAADGTVAWAKSYDHKGDRNPNRPRGRISRDIARMLLQPFGVIQAREARKRVNADPMRDSYRCILDANTYLRSFDRSLYGTARDCLEHAAAGSHPPVDIFVRLARLYAWDYEVGGAGGPAGDRATLDRAYQMALRAVDAKPTSAGAQFAMEQVLLARGDFEQAKIAGENALSLNPYDNSVIFGHAARLILTGQIDEGIAALRQNTNKKTAVWTGHHFLLALGSYLKDDLTTADIEAGQIASENFAPGLMLDAIVASKNGNRPRARQDIELLYAKYPSWRTDPRANIGYFLPDHDMANRIGEDFAAAAANAFDIAGGAHPAEP